MKITSKVSCVSQSVPLQPVIIEKDGMRIEVSIDNASSSANLVEYEAGPPITVDDCDAYNGGKAPLGSTAPTKKKKGTSNLETLMHMIKANIGTGVLAMPLAFKNGGLVLSGISLWIMGFICIHCMHILLDCYKYSMAKYVKPSDKKKSSENIGYEDVVQMIAEEKYPPGSKWPRFFKVLVSVFLIIGQLGFCCVYLVFVPKNIKQVVDVYYPSNDLSVEALMAIVLGPLALFCLIKNLKILAPFSTFANFLMIGSMFVIMYELFFDGGLKPFSELVLVGPFESWPIYFSSAIYAFEGISLVLPVYHEMRNKSEFTPWNGVLNTSMILVAVMYFSIGFFGYMKYGSDSEASITLNLPNGQVLFQVIKILFAVAIFISYNLQFYVAADIMWSSIYRSSKYLQTIRMPQILDQTLILNGASIITSPSSLSRPQTIMAKLKENLYSLYENLFRIALVVFTFALAVNVPRIDLFISLVGSIASSTLAIIIPPIMDHIVFYESSNRSKMRLLKNVLIVLFGVYIFVSGTYVSLRDIVDYLKNKA